MIIDLITIYCFTIYCFGSIVTTSSPVGVVFLPRLLQHWACKKGEAGFLANTYYTNIIIIYIAYHIV